jgi:L-alanine-DL-glutamate epimerase-like enolase superfamily enzyme
MSVFTWQWNRRSDRRAMPERLTLKSARVRSVSVPLRRPVVSKVGLFTEWPLIVIDLYTNEGVVGHSYLEPYLKNSSRYIIPAIEDLVTAQVGKRLAPLGSFQASRRSLNLVGYEGITMIAVAGVDMAIWDALAKAAGMPLAVMLGASLGGVPAYNSNGPMFRHWPRKQKNWWPKASSRGSSFASGGIGWPTILLHSAQFARVQATKSS